MSLHHEFHITENAVEIYTVGFVHLVWNAAALFVLFIQDFFGVWLLSYKLWWIVVL